jgi:hypothetical protein
MFLCRVGAGIIREQSKTSFRCRGGIVYVFSQVGVLVSSPIWGSRPDFFLLSVAGLLMWGAHSDERSLSCLTSEGLPPVRLDTKHLDVHVQSLFFCHWTVAVIVLM